MIDLMPPVADWPGVADTGVDAFLAKVRAETTPMIWWTLVGGALAYALLPLFTVYVPLPAFLLPSGLRARHAERAYAIEMYLPRQALFLVKMYACMCWGQNDAVRTRMALAPYPPDPGTFRTS
jgi:hypothetical protein